MQFDSRVGLPIKRFSFALSLNWSRTLHLDRNIVGRAWCFSVKSAKRRGYCGNKLTAEKKTSMWKYTICSQEFLYMHIINTGLFAETSIHIQMKTIFICFRALFFCLRFYFLYPFMSTYQYHSKASKLRVTAYICIFDLCQLRSIKMIRVFFAKWR